jgi:hypothetical protein
MYDYRDDMKVHKQRVLTFKENLVKAYGLIWDDYMTTTMQNRIEQHPEYASKIKNNPVELMLAICASMHETVRAQHSILTLFLALTKFFTNKQKEDMTVAERCSRNSLYGTVTYGGSTLAPYHSSSLYIF